MGKKTQKLTTTKTNLALVEAAPRTTELKLDLGCGLVPKEGHEGVDLYGDKAKHKVDLFKFPWRPFKNNSVDEINASHLLEHIPAREVEERDITPGASQTDREQLLGKDMLFAFMDECYRILKPGAWMHIVVPSGRSNRAFWDPTHRRFFMQETFLYFAANWRKMNSLQHYRLNCNFGVDCTHSMPQVETLRSGEVQQERLNTLWNVTVDWIARLQKQEAVDPDAPMQIQGTGPGQ